MLISSLNFQKHSKSMEDLVQSFTEIVQMSNQDLLQENANVDGRSPMGLMGKIGSEAAKFYVYEHMLSGEVKQAVLDNYIHVHDADFMPTGTTTCCQIPLGKVLKGGFNTGHGHMREPQDIHSAMALASIIIQSNQNMQHGGQSMPNFDFDLAPYIKLTFSKHITRLTSYPTSWTEEEIYKQAWHETKRDTYQACEAFIHNCNSMHSRGGGQVPFISINYGTDTSLEGRLLIECILTATQAGLGNGETPIFPIQVFKLKKGINYQDGEVNYDLYKLALQTTSKRLFPNFSFIDSSFNLPYYDGTSESEVSYMGCRTRVMGNRHGSETSVGRGNLSFTTINLVKIALTSNDLEDFYKNLNHFVNLVIEQLYNRYLFQAQKQAKDFIFLYSQGIWRGSEGLDIHDKLEEVLKQGTLSVGFIGLAEALTALTGMHHGENEDSYQLGLQIISFLRGKCDYAADMLDLNYSLIATPAEGLSGKFTKRDQKEFGVIKGVTDQAYYTNSFHIPVHYKIKAIDKIKKEGPFHSICNAGHISYIEVDGKITDNLEAMDMIVKAMANADMGYGSINHPVDHCKSCGYNGIIEFECPKCKTTNEEDFERIRRITGYLVGDMKKWNTAKAAEELNRRKHK